MKNRYLFLVYLLFNFGTGFSMEDVDEYNDQLKSISQDVNKIYKLSKKIQNINDQYIIAKMTLDFYESRSKDSNDIDFLKKKYSQLESEYKIMANQRDPSLRSSGRYVFNNINKDTLIKLVEKISSIEGNANECAEYRRQIDDLWEKSQKIQEVNIETIILHEKFKQINERFEEISKSIDEIYKESEQLPSIYDQLKITTMVLDFYKMQLEKSAEHDAPLFSSQVDCLKKALDLSTGKDFAEQGYYVVDIPEDEELASIKKTILSAKYQIHDLVKHKMNLINIALGIGKRINNLEKEGTIKFDFLEKNKLPTLNTNGSIFDIMNGIKETLSLIDDELLKKKEKKIIDTNTFELLTEQLSNAASLFNNTVPVNNQKLTALRTIQCVEQQRTFDKACQDAIKKDKVYFSHSWEDFCQWQSDGENNAFKTNIDRYIRQKKEETFILQEQVLNELKSFISQANPDVFSVSSISEDNISKTLEGVYLAINLITLIHSDKLKHLPTEIQNCCIKAIANTAGLRFVNEINIFAYIRELSFDELLFLGSVFYPTGQHNILPNPYAQDFYSNNTMTKTPKNLIKEHLNCYRQYKKHIPHDNPTRLKKEGNIKLEPFSVVKKSLALHVLSLVTRQGMPKKEISSILNTLSNGGNNKCFNNTLASVYAFCKFYNEYLQKDPYTSETINTLMTQEKVGYFPIWHSSFIEDIKDSNIETANNGAIIKILSLDKDIRNLFPTKMFFAKDIVFDNGIGYTPEQSAQARLPYDTLLINYLCIANQQHSPICENLNVNNYIYWKGVKDLYDSKDICTKNPKLFFHTYFILMSGLYERSIASPWLFTKNTSLPKFKDIYNRTYNNLKKSIAGKNNINTEIVDLMYINWWYDLYTPKIQEPFADYDAKKQTLLENAKIINDTYRKIAEGSIIRTLIINFKQFIDDLINNGYLRVANNTSPNYNENISARSKDFFDAYYRCPEYKDLANYYFNKFKDSLVN